MEPKKPVTIKVFEPGEVMTEKGIVQYRVDSAGVTWVGKDGKRHWTNCPYRVDEE